VSVSERTAPGLTALVPSPGIYCNESERYEIRCSKRGHWYAMRLQPDGCTTYVAQRVDLATLTGPLGPGMEERKGSGRQSSGCTQLGCGLSVWRRGLCGMHLSADAVRRAKAIRPEAFPALLDPGKPAGGCAEEELQMKVSH
jgi:hypothetical protein